MFISLNPKAVQPYSKVGKNLGFCLKLFRSKIVIKKNIMFQVFNCHIKQQFIMNPHSYVLVGTAREFFLGVSHWQYSERLKLSNGSIGRTSKMADSNSWPLVTGRRMRDQPELLARASHSASTCGLSFTTVWWLRSQSFYLKRPKVQAAVLLRWRPENWHSLNPAIFYWQSSDGAH